MKEIELNKQSRFIPGCLAGTLLALSLQCTDALAQAAPAAASAPAPTPDFTFTSNVAIASQYVSRGFRQTWGKPALQGGMDLTHSSGWFAGTWASTVSHSYVEDASLEWDLYTGYAATAGDFGYGATLYYYVYPGGRLHFADASYNYGEIVPTVSWKFVTLKYWLTYTRDYFGYNDRSLLTTQQTGSLHSRGSGYLDLTGNFDLGEGVALAVHYGAERVTHFSVSNWKDAKVGVTKTFGPGWSVGAAYTRAWDKNGYYRNYTTGALDSSGNAAVSDPTRATLAVTLARTF